MKNSTSLNARKIVIGIVLLTGIYACTSEPISQQEELAPMVHTLYTDSVELFVNINHLLLVRFQNLQRISPS